MAKFPSQRKLLYPITEISETTMDGEGYLNLPKDLSILNRRGYASTTRKGVPLVFQCRVDFYLQNYLGQGPATATNPELQATLKLVGAQNNWVYRNAAVKWHAALQEMRKEAGIRKSDLGAYAHEIRYEFDQNGQTWVTPIDGDGDAFAGGDWDTTRFTTYSDQDFGLKLVGTGTSEESSGSLADVQNLAYSYLLSRAQPLADSNEHIGETPADHSILKRLLAGNAMSDTSSRIHDAKEDAEGQGDNPPYDLIDISASGDVNNDITEGVELGRAVSGHGNAYGSMIVEIPFGLAGIRASIHEAGDPRHSTDPSGLMCVEVLDIYEMQG